MLKRIYLICIILTVLVGILNCNQKDRKGTRLTVVSYGGGAYQQSHIDAFFAPYERLTGNKVESVVWNADYSKLKAMVESGRVPWDVVEVTEAGYKRGLKDNLFEKLTDMPSGGNFLPGTRSDYGVANVYWATVMAYMPSTYQNKRPTTWQDFWDVKKFPGPRALYDDPRGNLEFALLADGIPIESLYPLDIDRAFAKLDKIKPYVRVWWTDGTQPVQLLQTGSVALSSAWNGRIFAMLREGVKFEYSWEGAALELDWWVIPKGSKNSETASKFIAFASEAENMANQAKLIGYGPVNLDAINLIPGEVKKHLPTEEGNWKVSFVVNSEWWSQNEEIAKKRWIAWKAK